MGLIRKPHLLKGTKNAVFPTRLVFVDTETNEHQLSVDYKQHTLKLGVACYLKQDQEGNASFEWLKGFRSSAEFWDWCLSFCTLKQRIVIMAHNLDFDFMVLNGINELASRKWFAQNLTLSGQVDIWTFNQFKYKPESQAWVNYMKRHKREPTPRKSLLFLDTMNYFKMSLANLGKSIGREKMEIDFATCSDEYLLEYCKNDVEIMVQAWVTWTDFLRENNLGCWGKTLPSQAFNAFRHRFMDHEIYIHSHTECLALERASYFGGRTECFQMGEFKKGPYYLLDVNSLYPSVMIHNKYPTLLRTYIKNPSIDQIHYCLKDQAVIAKVKVHTEKPFIPQRSNTRLIFPVGTFWTALATPELKKVLKAGKIIEVAEMAVYDQAPIFTKYVKFFWNERLKAKARNDTAYSMIYKLLMNSLYGKFGQTLDEYVYLTDDPAHEVGYYREYNCDEQRWIRYKRMNGKIEVFNGKGESYNSFPAIAAHVTSYARLKLWQIISKVPHEHRFYCDTDSIIVDSVGYQVFKRHLNDTTLGGLHLENESKSIIVNNVKDYVFAEKRKLKGVRGVQTDIYGKAFSQWHQVSLRSVLWGAPRDACLWKKVDKHIKGRYLKGDVHQDGFVTPYSLVDPETASVSQSIH